MEDLARTALGLTPPPAPPNKPAPKSAAGAQNCQTRRRRLAPLLDEQFRVFELAYGSGPPWSSRRTPPVRSRGEVRHPVAQPDLYGGVAVLVKNVTDAAHLDDTPRMKLIDAVERGLITAASSSSNARRHPAPVRPLSRPPRRCHPHLFSGAEAIAVIANQ